MGLVDEHLVAAARRETGLLRLAFPVLLFVTLLFPWTRLRIVDPPESARVSWRLIRAGHELQQTTR